MHLIQEIGSYAGLAAIPGLAVLSALYFSQARDVRRLREWAGRAPERAAEQAVGGRVAAQPQQRPAVAAGNGADAQTGERTAAGPGALTPAAVATAAAGATKPAPARAGAGAVTSTVPRTAAAAAAAARPATAVGAGAPRGPIPRVPGAATAIRPASAREPDPWYRRFADRLPAGRYVALIVAGALVLGGGAAYGITQLASSDNGSKRSNAGAASSDLGPASKHKSSSKKSKAGSAPAIDPSKVTVTVVNGTTIRRRSLPRPDEVDVPRHARGDPRAGVLHDQAAEIVGLALVQDRHDVHVHELRGPEPERHTVLLRLELVVLELGVRLLEPVAQPVHELSSTLGS